MSETAENVELVWLYVRMSDRACCWAEAAGQASAEGDDAGDRAAMRQANRFNDICNRLAREIRETIPGFRFTKAEAWLREHTPSAAP